MSYSRCSLAGALKKFCGKCALNLMNSHKAFLCTWLFVEEEKERRTIYSCPTNFNPWCRFSDAAECTPCTADFYKPFLGNDPCQPCPPESGTSGSINATQHYDCQCKPGFYVDSSRPFEDGCTRCLPDYYFCMGGGPASQPQKCPPNSRVEYGVSLPSSIHNCELR